jgi:hypothetical protein
MKITLFVQVYLKFNNYNILAIQNPFFDLSWNELGGCEV